MTKEAILKDHFNRNVIGYSYDNVISVPGYAQEVLFAALAAMEEYREQEVEKLKKTIRDLDILIGNYIQVGTKIPKIIGTYEESYL